MALFSFVDMRTFSVFKCQKCCCLPVWFVARIISWICPTCFFPFPSLLLLPFRKKCALLWRLPFFFFSPQPFWEAWIPLFILNQGRSVHDSGHTRIWHGSSWVRWKSRSASCFTTLGTSTLKKKIHWKFNKERNWRNSHGKAEFLESDEFSPFHLVNIQQITTAKANMT